MNARDLQQFSLKAHEDKYGPVGLSESCGGVYVWPYSGGTKRHSWALYVFPDGSAQLYTQLSETGALLGKPIKLPAPKFSPHKCEVLLKSSGSVDVMGAIVPKFKEKGSFPCGLPATRLVLPEEVCESGQEGARPIWICPGHDEYTLVDTPRQ